MKRDRIYLKHILECLSAIEEYVLDGESYFLADRKTQKAVLRELQELSESTKRLSSELKSSRPGIPWRDIAGFRNLIVHDYLGLSMPRIWDIIERDLSPLREMVEGLLDAQP